MTEAPAAATMAVPSSEARPISPSNGPSPYSQIPLQFKVSSSGRELSIDDMNDQPIMAVTIPTRSITGNQTINIHTTADPKSAILGFGVNKHSAGKTVPITINGATKSLDTEMNGHWGFPPHFEIVIPVEGGKQERFEWRQTSSDDAKDLGKKRAFGLVRIGGIGRKVEDSGEIVAVWSTDFYNKRLGGHFKFTGAGATGELGETFASCAIISAVVIGKVMREMLFAKAFSAVGYGA